MYYVKKGVLNDEAMKVLSSNFVQNRVVSHNKYVDTWLLKFLQ